MSSCNCHRPDRNCKACHEEAASNLLKWDAFFREYPHLLDWWTAGPPPTKADMVRLSYELQPEEVGIFGGLN